MAITSSAATSSVAAEADSLFHKNAVKPLITGDDANYGYDPKGGASDDEIAAIIVKLEDDPLLAVTI